MMSGFDGFSDADIRKMKSEAGSRIENTGNMRRQRGGRTANRLTERQRSAEMQDIPVSQDMLIGQPQQTNVSKTRVRQRTEEYKSGSAPSPVSQTGTGDPAVALRAGTQVGASSKTTNPGASESGEEVKSGVQPTEQEVTPEKDIEMDEKVIVGLELNNMEKFQKQQKQMEDMNKKKQKMLASAIEDRQTRAKAETAKMLSLQKELARLDQLLTIDVSIIRDRIEEASRDFLDAQKRYERAEKEFIDAKLDYHSKAELKEQMTEHLYTVIYQNETRKAKKLAELMDKLNIEATGEDVDMAAAAEVMMPHPSLLSPVQLPIGHLGSSGMRLSPSSPACSPPTSPPVTVQPAVLASPTDVNNTPGSIICNNGITETQQESRVGTATETEHAAQNEKLNNGAVIPVIKADKPDAPMNPSDVGNTDKLTVEAT